MVVPLGPGSPMRPSALETRLRESIHRLGEELDGHSPVEMARWARITRSAAATERRLRASLPPHGREGAQGYPDRAR